MSATSGSTSNSGSGNSSSDSSSDQTYAEGTLSYGSTGSEVKKMQQALKALGYNVSADGSYGALTQMAVTQFQKRNGLTADGVAGSATLKLLYSGSAKEADPSDNIPTIDDSTGKANGPSVSSVKLLHWYNDVKPSLKNGNKLIVFDPATNLQWTLKVYSLGRPLRQRTSHRDGHADHVQGLRQQKHLDAQAGIRSASQRRMDAGQHPQRTSPERQHFQQRF